MDRNWPILLGAIAGMAAVLLAFQTQTAWNEEWRYAAKYTARAGFPIFLAAYLARPMVDLTRSGWAKYLLARRKYFGLGFAVSHTIHLVVLVAYIEISGQGKGLVTYVFGGLAYAVLYAMAFTSNAHAIRAMGVWWKRLHRFGIHYLWLIFLQSYLGRAFVAETQVEGVLLGGLALIAGSIRLAAWLTKRGARRAASARSA